MGWGSKQTTTNTNTATNSNTTTPNLNPLAQNEYSSVLFPQANALIANANKPVYGDAQKADVLNNLNDLANASAKHLNSTLAATGQLNSGQDVVGQSNIEQQRMGQLSNFYTNLPAMEQQAHQQNMLQALGFGAGLTGQLPVGQTNIGDQSASGQTVTSSNPGLGGLVGGLLGGVGSALTGGLTGGLGSMASGGGFGAGFGQAMNPMGNFMNSIYGGPAGSPPNQFNPAAQPSYGQLPLTQAPRPIPYSV